MIKSIIKYSQLEDRLDAEYYRPEYIESLKYLWKVNRRNRILDSFQHIKGYAFESVNYQKMGVGIYRVSNIYDKSDFSKVLKVPSNYWDKYKRFQIKPKDIIITVTGNTVGLNYLMPNDVPKLLLNQNAMILRAKSNYSTEFLFAYFQTKYFRNIINRNAHMGTRPFLGLEFFDSVTLPSIDNKQNSLIQDMINQSYEKYEQSEQKYQQAQKLLNEYLQINNNFELKKHFSIPFSQIESRLDGEYYQTKILENLPVFSKGIVNLGELTQIKMGKTPSKQSYTQKGVRIIKVRDLTNKGIDWSENNRAFTTVEAWEKSEKARVKENDILLISAAHQAYYIGKEIDIVFDIPNNYQNKLSAVAELLIIRSLDKINPYVLLWYLRTSLAYNFIQQIITGETSHLYPKDLQNLPIPKILLEFQNDKIIENLTKEAILLQKESKQLIEKAKNEVERIIEERR